MSRSRSQAAQLLLLLAPAVGAQDFYWLAGSTRAQGMAGIAVPTHGSAMDALGANPALVASLVRPTIDLSLTGGFVNGSFANQSNSASPLRSAPGAIPAAAIAFPVVPGKLTLAAGATP